MPTKDIKVDYGAVGNGQLVTTPISITTGTSTLTFTSNLFVGGDVGKYISFGYTSGGVDPGQSFQSKIDTVNAFGGGTQTIVIHDTYSADTLTSYSSPVEWGTDDAPAFSAFADYRVTIGTTDTVTLTIPAGRYCFATSTSPVGGGQGSGRWAAGAGTLVVNGAGQGVSILSSMRGTNGFFWLGSRIVNNTNSPYTYSVTQGSTYVNLKTPSQASLFTVGQYALMSALESQPFGFPLNLNIFEHVLITNTNSSTGRIDFSAPLKYTYPDTYPEYPIGTFNSGGPAVLFPAWPDYGCNNIFNNLTVSQDGTGTVCGGLNITFNNCSATGPLGFGPTDNQSFTVNNCDLSPNFMEVDKTIENLNFNNTTIGRWQIQSACVNNLNCNNLTVTTGLGANGTARQTSISGSNIVDLNLGAFAFGACDTFSAVNSTISKITQAGAGDTFGGAGVQKGYTMSNGTIIIPKDVRVTSMASNGSGGTRCTCTAGIGGLINGQTIIMNVEDNLGGFLTQLVLPITVISSTQFDMAVAFNASWFQGIVGNGNTGCAGWAIPGHYAIWGGGVENGTMFKIISVTADAINTYVQTSMSGGFPPVPLDGGGALHINLHPAPSFTMTNCTGCDDAVDLSQSVPGKPVYIYSKRTYNKNTLLPSPNSVPGPRLWGNLVSIKIDITTPYTGIQPTFMVFFTDIFTLKSDYSTFRYSPQLDATVGPRTVLITPSGVTGSAGADQFLDISSVAPLWWTGGTPFVNTNHDVSGENAGPVITITYNTDQGFSVPASIPTFNSSLTSSYCK